MAESKQWSRRHIKIAFVDVGGSSSVAIACSLAMMDRHCPTCRGREYGQLSSKICDTKESVRDRNSLVRSPVLSSENGREAVDDSGETLRTSHQYNSNGRFVDGRHSVDQLYLMRRQFDICSILAFTLCAIPASPR